MCLSFLFLLKFDTYKFYTGRIVFKTHHKSELLSALYTYVIQILALYFRIADFYSLKMYVHQLPDFKLDFSCIYPIIFCNIFGGSTFCKLNYQYMKIIARFLCIRSAIKLVIHHPAVHQ